MPALQDPIEPRLARALRRAVLAHRTAPERTWTTVHVGDPVGGHFAHAVRRDERLDAALRADILAALLTRLRSHGPAETRLVWLARPGGPDREDVDAAWLSAAVTAYAEAGVDLTFVVVTRDGWLDPRSGASVVWKRLRDRSRPSKR